MKATEDFLSKVLIGYVIAAAKEILRDGDEKFKSVTDLADEIVQRYTWIFEKPQDVDTTDRILLHSIEVTTLCLLLENYHDATREGDGRRIMLIWRFLLLVFKASNRTNYSKEAAILLAQYHFLFSDRKVEELLYSRFINTHGRKGCNIPCDLHMEHLNRKLKTVLRNLRSNIQSNAIVRAGKSIGVVHSICNTFETATSKVKCSSNRHGVPCMDKEIKMIVESLEESPGVFTPTPKRSSVFSFDKPILAQFDRQKLEEWLVQTIGAHVLRTQ